MDMKSEIYNHVIEMNRLTHFNSAHLCKFPETIGAARIYIFNNNDEWKYFFFMLALAQLKVEWEWDSK